jgi:hypothetical protein
MERCYKDEREDLYKYQGFEPSAIGSREQDPSSILSNQTMSGDIGLCFRCIPVQNLI